MITQMAFFGVFVKDLEAAIRFYQDLLGFNLDVEASIPGQYAQFNFSNGCALALFQGDAGSSNTPLYEVGLFSDDAHATYTRWKEQGVGLVDVPQDMPFGRTFVLDTPHGYALRVIQRSRSV